MIDIDQEHPYIEPDHELRDEPEAIDRDRYTMLQDNFRLMQIPASGWELAFESAYDQSSAEKLDVLTKYIQKARLTLRGGDADVYAVALLKTIPDEEIPDEFFRTNLKAQGQFIITDAIGDRLLNFPPERFLTFLDIFDKFYTGKGNHSAELISRFLEWDDTNLATLLRFFIAKIVALNLENTGNNPAGGRRFGVASPAAMVLLVVEVLKGKDLSFQLSIAPEIGKIFTTVEGKILHDNCSLLLTLFSRWPASVTKEWINFYLKHPVRNVFGNNILIVSEAVCNWKDADLQGFLHEHGFDVDQRFLMDLLLKRTVPYIQTP